MKPIFNALFFFIVLSGFVSCSKENLTTPKAASIQTSTPISFTSENIAISGFQAQKSNNQISVNFTTNFQKGVKSIEIMRGTTPNNLCSIFKTDVTADSFSSEKYATEDVVAASTQYYMVKYTLQNNDWGYTPVFTLQN